jgi:hypothetical protein
MNLLRNSLLMRKTGDRRRTELTEIFAFLCGFPAEFITRSKQPHSDKSEYRPLTQGRERVGASPQEYRPLAQDSHRAENVGCGSVERWPRDLSAGAAAKEYRPLTQESAVTASKIQTFRARNTDLSRKGYRPFAQGITDRRRKELPTPRAKTAPNTDLSHK